MKFKKKIPLLLLFILWVAFLTGGASAEDNYSISGFERVASLSDAVSGFTPQDAISVRVTAERDCTLFLVSYAHNGSMIAVQSAPVKGQTGEQRVPIVLPDNWRGSVDYSGTYPDISWCIESVKIFLIDTETSKPLCPSVMTDSEGNPIIHAILYRDGDMEFQLENTPKTGKTAMLSWQVRTADDFYPGNYSLPWAGAQHLIKRVIFADKIHMASTSDWFKDFPYLQEALQMENLVGVTNMESMFEGCEGLSQFDFGSFDSSNVTNMKEMFAGCSGLSRIYAPATFAVNQTKVDSEGMFADCVSLIGENGTTYSEEHTDGEYARIDSASAPGYFTKESAVLQETNLGVIQNRDIGAVEDEDGYIIHFQSMEEAEAQAEEYNLTAVGTGFHAETEEDGSITVHEYGTVVYLSPEDAALAMQEFKNGRFYHSEDYQWHTNANGETIRRELRVIIMNYDEYHRPEQYVICLFEVIREPDGI